MAWGLAHDFGDRGITVNVVQPNPNALCRTIERRAVKWA